MAEWEIGEGECGSGCSCGSEYSCAGDGAAREVWRVTRVCLMKDVMCHVLQQ